MCVRAGGRAGVCVCGGGGGERRGMGGIMFVTVPVVFSNVYWQYT